LPLNDAVNGADGVRAVPAGSGDPVLDVARLTPSVPVTATQAAEAVRATFGLSGELERLPGEADHNFSLRAADGRRYVVKVAHLRAEPSVISAQVRILMHIESVAPGLPVQRVVPSVDGQPWVTVASGPLRGRIMHVTTYLDGQLLRSVPTSPALRRGLGATLAALGRALRDFDDPLASRPLLWDLAQLPQLRSLVAELPPGEATDRLGQQLARFTAEVAPRLARQRTQLVHNDFSPDNVLIGPEASAGPDVGPDASAVCGIIDFGDVTVTALVNDVAIAAAYQLGAGPGFLESAVDLISGYHATTPLTADELDLLPDLMLARILARIVISEWRAARFPENRAYILRNTPRAWDHLGRLLAIPADELTARIHEACRPQEDTDE
jgi:Ser/Thr protein kinase RdoA (MazF antagonist)